jgi:DNA-binding transcriptional ArsR family regulator
VTTYATAGWTALGDPTRRAIFERLVEGPRAVTELATTLPVSRSAVSQHLKVLKSAGLVVDRQAGKQRIYHVDPDGLAALRAELEGFWTKTLAAYKTVVEQPTRRAHEHRDN